MTSGGFTLPQQFDHFAKFGDNTERPLDGKTITLTQVDFWLKQAKILDNKRVTLTDTGICFNKFRVRAINYPMFIKFLEFLCERKDLTFAELKEKLCTCGLPGEDKSKEAKAAKQQD